MTGHNLCNKHLKALWITSSCFGLFFIPPPPLVLDWHVNVRSKQQAVEMINELVNNGMCARLPHPWAICIHPSSEAIFSLSDAAAAAEALGTWHHDSALLGKTPGAGGTGVGH